MNTATPENTWVFLSHSNKDFKILTGVRNTLEALGYRPLLFYLKCLDNDDEITDLICREIDARERFILCRSSNTANSRWVGMEVKYIEASGRPYEIIDLEVSTSINEGIERFNQRSTVYVWSTLKTIRNKVIKRLSKETFNAINLELSGANSKGIPPANNSNIRTFCLDNQADLANIVRGAYLIVLISRPLKEEEAASLKHFIKEYNMNAFAYEFEKDHFVENGHWASLDSDLFINRRNVDNIPLIKDEDKKQKEENIDDTIVSKLTTWDRKRNKKISKEDYTIYDTIKIPGEIIKSVDVEEFEKKLRNYWKSHKEKAVLAKPIDEASHTVWFDEKTNYTDSVKDQYKKLRLSGILNLLNTHAHNKEIPYSSMFECTDLKILLRTLEDLNDKELQKEHGITNKHGHISAFCCYIIHLLEANGIWIY